MDRLSALFVFVTALVYLPVSIYSAAYMRQYLGRYSLRSFGIYYHLLFASIVLLLVAADVVTFLFSWELMSILSYLLVNYKHEDEYNTRAGYLMLAMSEAGTLAAALALLLLAGTSGKLDFASLKAASTGMSETVRWAVFLLSFFGFGVKVGLVPSNAWLPRAHPAATGNVSAILSGVILNLGLYGILRVNADMLPLSQVAPGIIVLIVGTVSALVGILYATTENDMKKMLAHSSIENMGIMTAGLGAGFVFAASGYPVLAGIAFTAALYHMTNHALYKALLFLGVGAVDASLGHRDMDRLGGLIKSHALDGALFSCRRPVHRGPAALQRFCQRMVDVADDVEERRSFIKGSEDCLRSLRRRSGTDGCFGGDMFREGFCHEFSGYCAIAKQPKQPLK